MDFDKFRRLVDEKPGNRIVPDADAIGRAGSREKGNMSRLFLKLEDGRITEASYYTYGCGFLHAAGSIVSQLIQGLTPEEARSLSEDDIDGFIGGFPPARKHYPELGAELLRDALERLDGET